MLFKLSMKFMTEIIQFCTVAIYWDFENVRLESDQTKCLIDLAQSQGRLVTQNVYANWNQTTQRFHSILERHHFQRINVEQGKNSADRKLDSDCREELSSNTSPNIFIIVSGDGGFLRLVEKLQSQEKYVIVVGRHVSRLQLTKLADKFYLDEELCKLAGQGAFCPF